MSLAQIARNFEDALNRRNIDRRRRAGWLPGVTPYMGYGNENEVRVLARATMMDPDVGRPFPLRFAFEENTPLHDVVDLVGDTAREAQRGWRQFFTTQVSFLPVTVKVGDRVISTHTDRSGYIDLLVTDHGFEPGWHTVEITPIQGAAVFAPVMIVAPGTRRGVVSDIDDTILVTWLPRAALAAWNSFVVHTNARQEVPGMAEFYHEILDDAPDAPIFYLSTGAWNTYGTLLSFMETKGFPVGPLLMTDWGPTPTGLFRSGQEHKRTQLRNLLIMFPEIEWTLVGDDGQHDPFVYDDLARDHPRLVREIVLRELSPAEQVLAHGTPDAATAARREEDIEEHGVPVMRGRDGFELLNKWRKRGT